MNFAEKILNWYDQSGRKNLPWQHPREPYRVWLSEIMLQQTQVKTVIPYFERFMEQFPTVHHLAEASEDKVFALWSGLGYYSRARNLHKTAQIVSDKYNGLFPSNQKALEELPGIGASTAAAIVSQAFNLPAAILDGNVKRLLTRFFLIEGWPQEAKIHKKLLEIAGQCLPHHRFADYSQAIMDMGATCCKPKKPLCEQCPLMQDCQAYLTKRVDELPHKKETKKLPVKSQQFLLIHHKNAVYLEKRAPSGLWGGLWCLPAIETEQCPISYIEEQLPFKVLNTEFFYQLKHSFSHYHLQIEATSISINPRTLQLNEPSGKWFCRNEISEIGMARPVSRLLELWYKKNENII